MNVTTPECSETRGGLGRYGSASPLTCRREPVTRRYDRLQTLQRRTVRDNVGAMGEQGNGDESTMCSDVVSGVLGGAGSLNIQRVVGP